MTTPVPIFVYHGIAPSASDKMKPYTVTPSEFSRHLDEIQASGRRCLTISELVEHYRNSDNTTTSQDLAAITFDDGYADFVDYALPMMRERGIASTLYATTGWMEGGSSLPTPRPDERFLSWTALRDLSHSGVEIGSHSHTHPQMDTLGKMAVLDELIRSKSLIEDAIGAVVRSFAYPHGYNSPTVRHLTKAVGYENAVAVRNALSHADDNPFRLARLMLFADTPFTTFQQWLRGMNAPVATARSGVTTLGWRYFRRGKAVITRSAGTDYS